MVVPDLKAEGDVAGGRIVSISSKISGISQRSWRFFATSSNPFSFSFPRIFARSSPAAGCVLPSKHGNSCEYGYII
jgi:hypothetical protein